MVTLVKSAGPLRAEMREQLATLPGVSTASWIGGRRASFEAFAEIWSARPAGRPIRVPAWALDQLAPSPAQGGVEAGLPAALAESDLIVVDFGSDVRGPRHGAWAGLPDVRLERARAALVDRWATDVARASEGRAAAVHVWCLDSAGPAASTVVRRLVGDRAIRRSSLLCGEVPSRPAAVAKVPASLEGNLLGLMEVEAGGVRVAGGIMAPLGRRGIVMHGPSRVLRPGTYRAEFAVEPHGVFTLAAQVRPVILEVLADAELLLQERRTFVWRDTLSIEFSLDHRHASRRIALRLFRGRWVDFLVTAARLTLLRDAPGR